MRLRQRTHKLGASKFQDLGTKKKRRAREAEPLGMQEGTGGCRPPVRGSGGLEAPQEERGVWGAAAPSKKKFDGEKVKPIHPLSDKVFELSG